MYDTIAIAENPLREDSRDKRILVLAPTRNDAAIACETLMEARIFAEPCSTIETLCACIVTSAGAAIIAQEALTPPAIDLLVATLAHQPPWSDIPIIILTQRDYRHMHIVSALGDLDRLHSATFLERPFTMVTLERAVHAALSWRERQYDIRDYVLERQRIAEERLAEFQVQREFVRGVLASVSGGKLIFCSDANDLPKPLRFISLSVTLTRNSLSDFRCEVLKTAEKLGFPGERQRDLITAASEAAMNAVVHAGGGKGWTADDRAGLIQVWVTDTGAGISMDRLPQATLERGYSSAGTLGHGFWLALNSCDRLYLQTGPAGTTIVLEQHHEPPPPSEREWWKAARKA